MPRHLYAATDADGLARLGTIDAADAEGASRALSASGHSSIALGADVVTALLRTLAGRAPSSDRGVWTWGAGALAAAGLLALIVADGWVLALLLLAVGLVAQALHLALGRPSRRLARVEALLVEGHGEAAATELEPLRHASSIARPYFDWLDALAQITIGRRDAGFARFRAWRDRAAMPELAHQGLLAILHERAGELDDALACRRRQRALAPDHGEVAAELAYALAEAGEHETEAEAALVDALALAETPRSAALATLARALLDLDAGRAERALQAFAQGAQALAQAAPVSLHGPTPVLLRAHVACALARLGEQEAAEAMWRALDPVLERIGAEAARRRWTKVRVACASERAS